MYKTSKGSSTEPDTYKYSKQKIYQIFIWKMQLTIFSKKDESCETDSLLN